MYLGVVPEAQIDGGVYIARILAMAQRTKGRVQSKGRPWRAIQTPQVLTMWWRDGLVGRDSIVQWTSSHDLYIDILNTRGLQIFRFPFSIMGSNRGIFLEKRE